VSTRRASSVGFLTCSDSSRHTRRAPALIGTIASLASIRGALRTAWNGAKRSSSFGLAGSGQRTSLRNFNRPQRPLTRTFGLKPHYIRWQTFSTSSDTTQESELIPLNDSLRRLYLKVHPDFFSQWPEVQVRSYSIGGRIHRHLQQCS
jgi:hypothetical protein